MKTEKASVKCEAVFSDDGKHRYSWYREWNKSKPTACIIMIAPSNASVISCDLSTMLCINQAEQLGYGAAWIVNLFSRASVSIRGREKIGPLTTEETDKYILTCAERADTVILAWGQISKSSKAIQEREKEVLTLLKPLWERVRVIADPQEKAFTVHPLSPSVRQKWILKACPFPSEE